MSQSVSQCHVTALLPKKECYSRLDQNSTELTSSLSCGTQEAPVQISPHCSSPTSPLSPLNVITTITTITTFTTITYRVLFSILMSAIGNVLVFWYLSFGRYLHISALSWSFSLKTNYLIEWSKSLLSWKTKVEEFINFLLLTSPILFQSADGSCFKFWEFIKSWVGKVLTLYHLTLYICSLKLIWKS